jgi:hypothetical protein
VTGKVCRAPIHPYSSRRNDLPNRLWNIDDKLKYGMVVMTLVLCFRTFGVQRSAPPRHTLRVGTSDTL